MAVLERLDRTVDNSLLMLFPEIATPQVVIPEAFGYWFSGFFDGEGHFGATLYPKNRPTQLQLKVQIEMSADNRIILQEIWELMGGRLYNSTAEWKRRRPTVTWRVNDTTGLALVIVPIFDTYPLRSTKAREYSIWRRLVIDRYKRLGSRLTPALVEAYRTDIDQLIELRPNRKNVLRTGRKQKQPLAEPTLPFFVPEGL